MPSKASKRAGRSAQPGRRWRVVLGLIALALAVTGAALLATRHGSSSPAVSVQGGPSGNQLHQFSGEHHAPFISLADYKPIYDRRDANYVLVDVREATERAQAKIPGDIWVPLADADSAGWKALEAYKDKTLVLYCDCPWAEAAKESVILEAHGFADSHLRVLHEGIPGWAQAGYPIVSGGDPCASERRWPQACGG